LNKTGALCPLCHGDLVERKTKQKKRIFYGCSNYPECNFAIWERPVAEVCPKCGGLMVIPKVGQDAVCYQEVIAVERNTEEKPKAQEQEKVSASSKATQRKSTTTEKTKKEKSTTPKVASVASRARRTVK